MFVINKIVNRRRLLEQIQAEQDQREKQRNRTSSSRRRMSSVPSIGRYQMSIATPIETHRLLELGFSVDEIRALRCTWKRLNAEPKSNPTSVRLIRQVFDSFLSSNAAAKELCDASESCPKTYEHARHLVRQIDSFVDGSTASRLRAHNLNDIGEYHYHRCSGQGFKSIWWEQFGERLVDVFGMQESIQAIPDAKIAWIRLFALFSDRWRCTHERSARRASLNLIDTNPKVVLRKVSVVNRPSIPIQIVVNRNEPPDSSCIKSENLEQNRRRLVLSKISECQDMKDWQKTASSGEINYDDKTENNEVGNQKSGKISIITSPWMKPTQPIKPELKIAGNMGSKAQLEIALKPESQFLDVIAVPKASPESMTGVSLKMDHDTELVSLPASISEKEGNVIVDDECAV